MADQFDDQHIQATISKLLSEAARHLALFLEKVLPPLFENWWENAVVNNLSFQQRRRMEQRNIGSLAALDLAALLSDLTWNDIEKWAGGKIVSRGKSYQQQDMEALKNWRDEFFTKESQ